MKCTPSAHAVQPFKLPPYLRGAASDTVCTYAQGMRMHRPDVDPFHHIFIERDVAGWEALDACLERTERLLRHPPNRPIQLIVIDSIAYIFRDAAEFGAGAQGVLPSLC